MTRRGIPVETARAIIAEYAGGDKSSREVARKYGVSQPTVVRHAGGKVGFTAEESYQIREELLDKIGRIARPVLDNLIRGGWRGENQTYLMGTVVDRILRCLRGSPQTLHVGKMGIVPRSHLHAAAIDLIQCLSLDQVQKVIDVASRLSREKAYPGGFIARRAGKRSKKGRPEPEEKGDETKLREVSESVNGVRGPEERTGDFES